LVFVLFVDYGFDEIICIRDSYVYQDGGEELKMGMNGGVL
jgi:hypothetical protein